MTDAPTRDDLEQLLELQRTDSGIARLEHKLDELPEQQQLEEAEERAREVQQQHGDARIELDRATAEQRKLEGEVDLLTQRKEAEQARMYGGGISNPRELQSLRAEIESTERRVASYEDELLEVMERVEALDATASELDERHNAAVEEVERLTAARDEAAQGILAELGELKAARARERAAIPDELLERYDRARERSGGGVAVGHLEGGRCTACMIELPMAEVNELLDGPPLTTCPQCRRLLIVGL